MRLFEDLSRAIVGVKDDLWLTIIVERKYTNSRVDRWRKGVRKSVKQESEGPRREGDF